jgi:hypothetical protein
MLDINIGERVVHEKNGEGVVVGKDMARVFYLVKFDQFDIPWYITPDRVSVINTPTEFIDGNYSGCKPEDVSLQVSETGSMRFNKGKPQSSEISPKFLLDMAAVLEKSREKYPRGNWAKGNNYSVPYDSMMRHLLAWQSGESKDIETGLSHLAHAALNLMMLHYYEENFPDMDDRIFKK